MQMIINIPEELYETYKDRPPMLGDAGMDMIAQSIANGKPLPKGHGRLIDLDAFLNLFLEFDLEIGTNALDSYPIIHYRFEEDNWKYMEEFTPIIVESDKED